MLKYSYTINYPRKHGKPKDHEYTHYDFHIYIQFTPFDLRAIIISIFKHIVVVDIIDIPRHPIIARVCKSISIMIISHKHIVIQTKGDVK